MRPTVLQRGLQAAKQPFNDPVLRDLYCFRGQIGRISISSKI